MPDAPDPDAQGELPGQRPGAEFPLASATLKLLLAEQGGGTRPAPTAFRLGPAVLRAPAAAVRRPEASEASDDDDDDDDDDGGDDDGRDTAALLGELLDMVLVGADTAQSGLPEVHLQFKASVFGGLHLRLVKRKEGLDATFIVGDAAARRAVADHVDALIVHLKERGFSVLSHDLQVQPAR